MTDRTRSGDNLGASLGGRHNDTDRVKIAGRFSAVCRDAAGNEIWAEEWDNLLTTVGKNFLLDQALNVSAYTSSEFMGLISSTSYSTVAAADTMASHAGWLEAGGANAPTYSGTRDACVWSVASAGVKALSAGLVFTFTGTGTVQGAFIVASTGAGAASATIGSTAGTLYSAGALGTPQPVISTNTLTLSYSTTLT